jgi:hypothetical protein
MRYRILGLLMLLCVATVAPAQVNIGINFSAFPGLVRVPGYPVYYAPQQAANYFFYDGMYWVYQDDYWYSSSWYNGPWWRADPQFVPEYLLRVPVRYYRRPPAYFRGWQGNAPPRWGEHWGSDWEQHRRGWDQWDHKAAPAPAPLPVYQKQYSGARYPKAEQQQVIQSKNYKYQAKDTLVREHFEPKMREAPAPAARDKQPEPQRKDSGKDERAQKQGPSAQPAMKSEPAVQQQRPQAPTPREPSAAQREQQAPKPAAQPPRSQPQAATPREPSAAPREQQAPKPAAQTPRPQPQAATPREPAAAPREQQAPKPAAQPPRPQPQAAPPRAPDAKSDRADEKGPEKGR